MYEFCARMYLRLSLNALSLCSAAIKSLIRQTCEYKNENFCV